MLHVRDLEVKETRKFLASWNLHSRACVCAPSEGRERGARREEGKGEEERREGGTVGGQREPSPQPFLPSEPVGADPFSPFTWDTQRALGGQ